MKQKINRFLSKQNVYYIISIILSFVSVFGLVECLNIGINTKNNLANHTIFLLGFILMFLLFNRLLKRVNRKLAVYSIILSFIYSFMFIIGSQLDNYGDIFWTLFTVLKILCLTVFIFAFTYYAMDFIINLKFFGNKTKTSKKQKIILFSIIFFINLLVFLAVFPGVYGYDSGFQILEFMKNDVSVTTSFSITYSFALSSLVQLGYQLFNSYAVGFAVFIFLQMTLVSYVEYRISNYVYEKSHNKIIFIISVLFLTLLPVNAVMKVSAAQDVVFAAIFALLVLNTIEILDDIKAFWNDFRKPLKYSILLLLLAVSKNNGIYVVLFAFIWALILLKHFRIKTAIMFIVPCCLYYIYSGVFLPAVGVVKGNSLREMLSIPCQQIARVYNYNPLVLSSDEQESILEIFNYGDLSVYQYTPSISDSMKGLLNTDKLKESFGDYAIGYLKIGIRDPKNYIEAFLMNNLGLWYPNKMYPDTRMYHPYIEFNPNVRAFNPNYVEIERQDYFKVYNFILEILVGKHGFQRLPGLSSLMQMGTYSMFLLFAIAIFIYKKSYKLLIPISFILGLYLTLLLAPVAIFRYFYPIMMVIPLVGVLLISNSKVYKN